MDCGRKSLFLTISAEVKEIGEVLEGKLSCYYTSMLYTLM